MKLTEADKSKLRDAFAVRASVSGNVMNLVGLDEVRERFPDMWERNRDRIIATTQAILKQHTDPRADVILPLSDARFVVLFTRLDKEEARLRAEVIQAEILRRFMGDEALNTLDMRVRSMEMDAEAMQSGAFAEMLSSTGAARSNDKPDQPRPRQGAAPSSANAEKAYLASMEELLGHASLPIDAVASRFEFNFDTLEFGFQPFLFLAKNRFTVFTCRAARYDATGDIIAGYRVLPREASAEQVQTLDKMLLMRARHGLVDMAVRKRVAVVVVPVSFETMTGRGTATEYLELLQKVPADLRTYLVSVLCRCPSGVPEGRLAELLNPLRRLSRAVGVRVDSLSEPLSAIKGAGAFSVGFNLSDNSKKETATRSAIERYAATARKLGLHTFIDGINSPDLAACCEAAQVDYLGGRAYAEMSDYVGPISERMNI